MKGSTAARAGWLLALSYVGFVSLGLPDTILGAAWPAVRGELDLPVDAAGAALLLTTLGIVTSSVASGRLRARLGTGAVLVSSTLLAALSLLASSAAGNYTHMLAAAFVAGLGGGAIDACLNEHVARHHSARHMNWLHACWGVGASISPAVVASVLAREASWRVAYAGLGAVELLLVLAFFFTRSSWDAPASISEASSGTSDGHGLGGRALAGVVMFFFYGGLEAGVGLWASTLLTETRGTTRSFGGAAVAVYWGALCAGRFLIGVKADQWGASRVLRASVWWSLLAALALALPGTPAWFVVAALAALGLGLAPIYPLTMHDTPRRFGPARGTRLVGYQVAATSVGMASLPWISAGIATSIGLAYLPALLCALAGSITYLESARRAVGSTFSRATSRRQGP